MKKIALAAMALLAANSAQADVLAKNATGTTNYESFYPGQSFTISGTGTFDNIVFSFQSVAGANVGAGRLYIFDKQYMGSPTKMASASSLGSATFSNGFYTFAPSFQLEGSKTYYALADSIFSVGTSSDDPYAGGDTYFGRKDWIGDGYQVYSNRDTRFALSGSAVATAVPEPATWAMMLIGFGAIGGMARRRNRGDARAYA